MIKCLRHLETITETIMIKRFSKKAAGFLVKNGADPEMEEVCAYGIECVVSTVLILVLLMAAGILLNKPILMTVFMIAWLPLRMLVGGAHANSHWGCTLVSVGLGTVSVWLSGPIGAAPLWATVTVSLLCYLLFFLTAPIVHRNHPISKRRYRRSRVAARIFAAAECAAIIALACLRSPLAAPAFMGYFTTAALSAAGLLSAGTDRSSTRISFKLE